MSRDIFNFLAPELLNKYLGRSSIASLVSPPSPRVTTVNIEYRKEASPWHRRMLLGDVHKTHERDLIADMAEDFVLVDLIEERALLLEPEPGSYLTHGELLNRTNLPAVLEGRPDIRIASAGGIEIWRAALPAFAAMLHRHVRPERVLLHQALYAEDHVINPWLIRMYADLRTAFPDAMVVECDPENLRSNSDHRWGAAPFHYADAYYLDLGRKIADAAGMAFEPLSGATLSNGSSA